MGCMQVFEVGELAGLQVGAQLVWRHRLLVADAIVDHEHRLCPQGLRQQHVLVQAQPCS